MEFAILGSLEALADGRQLKLGGPKQRAVLAMLLLDANRPVSRDRLIDGLWGASPPPSAGHTLDDYISRLRRALGADRIERRAPGYVIRVDPGELDLERFETLLEKGRAAAAAGDAASADASLRRALGLWRGRALADLEYEPFAPAEAGRLEERRLLALEGRIAAELELGRGIELVGELEALVAENPFSERLLGQLMLALYRAARPADALAVYQMGRRRLAAELGLEPGAELRELERRILNHDLVLAGSGSARRMTDRRPLKRRWLTASGAAVVLVVAVLIGIKLGIGTTGAAGGPASVNRVVALDSKSDAVFGGATIGDAPAAMAVYQQSLWLAEPNAGAVERVDRDSRHVVDRIPVGGSPGALTVGDGALWVASVPGASVTRIDPVAEKVTQTIPLDGARVAALAFGLGRLWVADATDAELLEIDPVSGQVVRIFLVDAHPTAIAFGSGAIWIADYDEGSVTEVDPRSGKSIATVPVGSGPAAIAIGDGSIWVANSQDSTVSRVDPQSDASAAEISVGSDPVALSVSGTSVFVADQHSSSLARIDVRRNVVTQTIPLAGGPTAVVSSANRLWVGTTPLAHHGGKLVLLFTKPLTLDPAFQFDLPQPVGFAYDDLVANIHSGGPQAVQLVPDLAISLPRPTDEGTTYTFRLRRGLRYSNGEPVRAEDFRRAYQRLFRLDSPGTPGFTDIVGATACSQTRCDLSHGIVTNDATRSITFHLRAADHDFPLDLASPAAAPVPRGTPLREMYSTPILGTGPYVVASSSPSETRYVRNPLFREWSPAAQPDGNPDVIIMRSGLSPTQEVRAVERGQADWTGDGVPPSLLPEVETRFASQAHGLQTTDTDFLALNTTLPPFNNVRVREAVNFAVDRAAVARLYGGPDAATPTCQLLPPGLLGYRRYCPYTREPTNSGNWRTPDIERAKRLVAASGTRGERVIVWGQATGGIVGTKVVTYVAGVLRKLGYRARARIIPANSFSSFDEALQVTRHFQLRSASSLAFTPRQFFAGLLTCSAVLNDHWFCDPRIDRSVREAQALETTNMPAATVRWTKIDRELVDRAVLLPLVNPHAIDFVSRRVRNYEADPRLGVLADQLSLR